MSSYRTLYSSCFALFLYGSKGRAIRIEVARSLVRGQLESASSLWVVCPISQFVSLATFVHSISYGVSESRQMGIELARRLTAVMLPLEVAATALSLTVSPTEKTELF